ncbi:MAG: hypothetical protein AAFN78_06100 [Pseudomonadota bacterium]
MKKTQVGLLLLAALLTYSLWTAYQERLNSPEERARHALVDGERLAGEGRPGAAAQALYPVLFRSDDLGSQAKEQFVKLLASDTLREAPGQELPALVRRAAIYQTADPTLVPDLLERVLEAADAHASAMPLVAEAIVSEVHFLADEANYDGVTATRLRLLESMNAEQAATMEGAVALGRVHARRGDAAAARTALEPVRGELGSGEGARILGQLDYYADQLDAAYPLLKAYVSANIDELNRVDAAWRSRYDEIWNDASTQFDAGELPDSFYREYDNADKAGRNQLFNAQVDEFAAMDAELVELQYRYDEKRHAAGVALDLGQLLALRGQTAASPEVRQATFEEAREILMSVSEFMGGSDGYRLNLGKVNYWLGSPDEGKEQFEALLEANDRSVESLYGLSDVLRDLGETAEARLLLDEAYEKAEEPSYRYAIASLRGILSQTLDEKLAWYERGDPDEPYSQANLGDIRGDIAARDGDLDTAAAAYRSAIDTYAAIDDEEQTANNMSLLYGKLFEITGELADYREGVRLIGKAADSSPNDPIVLINAATALFSAAATEVLAEHVDLGTLRSTGTLRMLRFLFADEAGRVQWVERVLQVPEFDNAERLARRALLLSPSSPDAYQLLMTRALFARDLEALTELETRAAEVDIDHSDAIEAQRRYTAGEADDVDGPSARKMVDNRRRMLERAERANAVTAAVSRTRLASGLRVQTNYDQSVDNDEIVLLAEAAHAQAPSNATRGALVAALAHRGLSRLAAADPDYAGFVARLKRKVSTLGLVAASFDKRAAKTEALLADADIRRALELHRDYLRANPIAVGGHAWRLMKAFDADFATEMAATFADSQYVQTEERVIALLYPSSLESTLTLAWLHEALGDTEASARVRANYAQINGNDDAG